MCVKERDRDKERQRQRDRYRRGGGVKLYPHFLSARSPVNYLLQKVRFLVTRLMSTLAPLRNHSTARCGSFNFIFYLRCQIDFCDAIRRNNVYWCAFLCWFIVCGFFAVREHFDDFLLIIPKGNLSLSPKTVTGLFILYSAIRNTPQNVYFFKIFFLSLDLFHFLFFIFL